MNKNLIFCYSGTGNCYFISLSIAKKLGNTDIVFLNKMPDSFNTYDYSTVGFVFPCHGGGLPIGMEDTLKKIHVEYSTYTWAVCSYSGYLGYGLKQIDKLFPLNYWGGISHHCSCIWLFPPEVMIPPLPTSKANERAGRLSRRIADDISKRKEISKNVPRPLANKVENLVWPLIASKKSKTFSVDNSRCIKCGQCVKLCPKGNISFDADNNILFGEDCTHCLTCLQYCHKMAISIGGSDKKRIYHNPEINAEIMMESVFHID